MLEEKFGFIQLKYLDSLAYLTRFTVHFFKQNQNFESVKKKVSCSIWFREGKSSARMKVIQGLSTVKTWILFYCNLARSSTKLTWMRVCDLKAAPFSCYLFPICLLVTSCSPTAGYIKGLVNWRPRYALIFFCDKADISLEERLRACWESRKSAGKILIWTQMRWVVEFVA